MKDEPLNKDLATMKHELSHCVSYDTHYSSVVEDSIMTMMRGIEGTDTKPTPRRKPQRRKATRPDVQQVQF